jgi:hypothetical protein
MAGGGNLLLTAELRQWRQVMDAIYDVNNNCVKCDEYIYDQHKRKCEHYVDESYLDFIKRIEREASK